MEKDGILICDKRGFEKFSDNPTFFLNGGTIQGVITYGDFKISPNYLKLGEFTDISRIIKRNDHCIIAALENFNDELESLFNYDDEIKYFKVNGKETKEYKLKFKKGSVLYLTLKYGFEYLIALVSLIFLLPFFVIIALLLKIDSPGPVFFRQKRFGRKMKGFEIYKFRSMYDGSHERQKEYEMINEMNGGDLFKAKNDPRVTRIGKVLRKFSLDELPQIFNILKGQMTIIGPRPLSTSPAKYTPRQLKRFLVKPGLACIWQAYHRNDTDFGKWVESDLYYVNNLNPFLDIKLFFLILKNVINGKGAK